jgi:ribosomal protein S26
VKKIGDIFPFLVTFLTALDLLFSYCVNCISHQSITLKKKKEEEKEEESERLNRDSQQTLKAPNCLISY